MTLNEWKFENAEKMSMRGGFFIVYGFWTFLGWAFVGIPVFVNIRSDYHLFAATVIQVIIMVVIGWAYTPEDK